MWQHPIQEREREAIYVNLRKRKIKSQVVDGLLKGKPFLQKAQGLLVQLTEETGIILGDPGPSPASATGPLCQLESLSSNSSFVTNSTYPKEIV